MTETLPVACELKRKVPATGRARIGRATAAFVFALALCSAPAFAQDAHDAPAANEAQDAHAAAAEGDHGSITDMILGLGWPLANFAIFGGVLYYFFNQPFRTYLAGRSATIRKELVEAAALKESATAQLASIDQKLRALPGEIEALRTRGAEEIVAEEQRITATAEADRDRLLDQTRREIELQVRLAKRAILEHAADLSVQLATERIQKDTTSADQDRMVDRYLDQVNADGGGKA